MKKNTMMRIASCLLVAVLLTTCVISGTYAKYTSKVEINDTARVAYWGFDSTKTEFGLFDYTDAGVSSDDKVIAPGTANTVSLHMVYTDNAGEAITAPEVDYTISITAEASGDYTNLDANENFKWTLKIGNAAATEYDKIADLVAAINALEVAAKYEAGTLPAAFQSDVVIGWTWKFAEDDVSNAADTELGNMADLETIGIAITVEANQVNE